MMKRIQISLVNKSDPSNVDHRNAVFPTAQTDSSVASLAARGFTEQQLRG